MSVSFGPLNSFADFFAALEASLASVHSAGFPYGGLHKLLLEELSAVHAWTLAGREPLLAERLTIKFPFAFARAREGSWAVVDGVPVEERPEDLARMKLAIDLVWLFKNWPENEEFLRRGRYLGAVSTRRSPELNDFPRVVGLIQAALAPLTDTSERPDAIAFDSQQPLLRDTMSTPQWARWVLLPRLEDVIKGITSPPKSSQLMMMVCDLALDEATWPLLYALGELDELFHAPSSIPIRLAEST